MAGQGPLRIGYVLWRYPAVSLTFVQREVAGLRGRGVQVSTFGVRPAHASELLTATEQDSFRTTWTVLPVSRLHALLVHLGAFLRWPGPYLSTLRDVLGEMRHGRPRVVLYFAEAVLLARHVRRSHLEHLHVHFADVAADVTRLAVRLERRRGARLTWSLTVHGPDELREHRAYRVDLKVADADLVVVISEYTRTQVLALVGQEHWDKVHVVHCGVDVERWPRRATDPTHGPLRLLTVGRLAAQKSHEVLVDALGLLRDRGIDVQLTIVGEGPSRGAIERRIAVLGLADRVRLVGAVGQDLMGDQFASHDLFCLASVAEGLPIVLMEAMATGLPVVATRITGVPELVEDGRNGLLVPPGRPDQLADAVERLVGDPGLRARFAAAGKQTVRERFDGRQSVSRLEQLLRDVARPVVGPAAPLAQEPSQLASILMRSQGSRSNP